MGLQNYAVPPGLVKPASIIFAEAVPEPRGQWRGPLARVGFSHPITFRAHCRRFPTARRRSPYFARRGRRVRLEADSGQFTVGKTNVHQTATSPVRFAIVAMITAPRTPLRTSGGQPCPDPRPCATAGHAIGDVPGAALSPHAEGRISRNNEDRF